MKIVLGVIISVLVLILFVVGLYSLFGLINGLISFKKNDELERKVIYETLAISFLVIMIIHFIQLIASIIAPEPFSLLAKFIISPGECKGSFFGNDPLHFDSFMIDITILGIVNYIIKKKYE